MGSERPYAQSEAAILARVIGADRDDLPVAAARAILKLDFESRDQARMHELALKAQEGSLATDERAEIEAYGRVGCLLDLMHSKARRSLKRKNAVANSHE